ncbi:MAG: uncharacterized protein KVP18_002879 [Porospora cf. gigantea A]|uniref:uncharacterized protein n=1 Tax=Porospora cf. gigantea A TaxID=2853593 RepID=UPI00355A14B0|nr:MAG: hypothetical protein KVP18_002879 [Porospora cf. gigantea A]
MSLNDVVGALPERADGRRWITEQRIRGIRTELKNPIRLSSTASSVSLQTTEGLQDRGSLTTHLMKRARLKQQRSTRGAPMLRVPVPDLQRIGEWSSSNSGLTASSRNLSGSKALANIQSPRLNPARTDDPFPVFVASALRAADSAYKRIAAAEERGEVHVLSRLEPPKHREQQSISFERLPFLELCRAFKREQYNVVRRGHIEGDAKEFVELHLVQDQQLMAQLWDLLTACLVAAMSELSKPAFAFYVSFVKTVLTSSRHPVVRESLAVQFKVGAAVLRHSKLTVSAYLQKLSQARLSATSSSPHCLLVGLCGTSLKNAESIRYRFLFSLVRLFSRTVLCCPILPKLKQTLMDDTFLALYTQALACVADISLDDSSPRTQAEVLFTGLEPLLPSVKPLSSVNVNAHDALQSLLCFEGPFQSALSSFDSLYCRSRVAAVCLVGQSCVTDHLTGTLAICRCEQCKPSEISNKLVHVALDLLRTPLETWSDHYASIGLLDFHHKTQDCLRGLGGAMAILFSLLSWPCGQTAIVAQAGRVMLALASLKASLALLSCDVERGLNKQSIFFRTTTSCLLSFLVNDRFEAPPSGGLHPVGIRLCAGCGRASGSIPRCICKLARYCNTSCRQKGAKVHGPMCGRARPHHSGLKL